MTVVLAELYLALRAAGVPEAKASAASDPALYHAGKGIGMDEALARRLADHAAQIAALKRDLEAVKEMLERLLRRP